MLDDTEKGKIRTQVNRFINLNPCLLLLDGAEEINRSCVVWCTHVENSIFKLKRRQTPYRRGEDWVRDLPRATQATADDYKLRVCVT